MTKQEFESRIGKKVTEDEFDIIENVYLNLPIMNKDEFCHQWRKVQFNPIVMELSEYVSILIRKISELKGKDKELREMILKY